MGNMQHTRCQHTAQHHRAQCTPIKAFASVIVASSLSTVSAADIAYNGWLEMFGKGATNNQAINDEQGIYPTNSFANIAGSLGVAGNLLSSEVEGQKLTYGFNFTAGSMVYDSTNKDFPIAPGSTNNVYMGWYKRYDNSLPGPINRLYLVNNAYLDYTYGSDEDTFSFEVKGGRYPSIAEYLDSFTQGFEVATNVRLSDEQSLRLWWFSSYGRAFAYGKIIREFWSVDGFFDANGKFINYGTHAFKAIYNFGGLRLTPYIYFSPGTYTAPALRVEYDTDRGFSGEGFRARTFVNLLAPIYGDRFFIQGQPEAYYYSVGYKRDKYTQSLIAQQQFDYNAYNFGLGVYKNFGHANAQIGLSGNPLLLDQWPTTTYDIGPTMSDVLGRDAITPYLFVGGTHFDSNLWWQLVGRWTDTVRSREHSLALNFLYKLDEKLSIGGKIEYLEDTTKAGYKVGGAVPVPGIAQNVADRSHMYLWIHYDI